MTLIEKYIYRHILALLTAILAITIAISWCIETLGRINFVTTNGQGLLSFLYLSILFLPTIMVTVIPFALTITIAQSLHILNQNSEIIIIANAAGSRLYIWRPIIALSLLFSIAMFLLANLLVPMARINMRSIIANANANFLNNVIQEDRFIELQKNLFIKIGKHSQQAGINNIMIADERDKIMNRYYYATNGHIIQQDNSSILVMIEGQLAKRNKINGETSLVKFSSADFDLGTLMSTGGKGYLYPKDQYLSTLLNYPKQAAEYKKYVAELHYRLISWLYPLVFAIIALALNTGPITHRDAKSNTALISTAMLVLTIYLLSYVFKNKAETNQNYIIALYLVPIIILFAGQYLYTHARNFSKLFNGLVRNIT